MTHEERLRAWAKGLHALVAATELLIRAYGGVFAKPGNPWVFDIEGSPDKAGIDFEIIPEHLGGLSGGERRLLMLAASLADVGVSVELGDVLSGLDREALNLVLAAVAHTGGSHEHSEFVMNQAGEASEIKKLPSLHPWPETA